MESIFLLMVLFLGIGAAFETEEAIVTQADFSVTPAQPLPIAWSSIRNPFFWTQIIRRPTDINQHASCLTYDSQPGTCRLIKDCYPFTRLHQQLETDDTWIIGSRGTCNYIERDGKKVNGVCCHNEENLARHGASNERFEFNNFTRIIDGTNAKPGEFPYMAAIMNSGRLYCGGSLIDSTHILTAAHCVSGMSPQSISKLSVILGTVNLNDAGKTTKRIKSVTLHKQFDSAKMYNDVALLTLDSPVTTVSPVSLCTASTGSDAVVAGWGKLSDGGSGSDVLKKVTLQIKSQEDCKKNFGNKAPGGIVDHYLCAAAPGKDSCGGDSGGPLIAYGCQVGIVSWGIGCATNTYGVYTRVSSFQTWINKNKSLT